MARFTTNLESLGLLAARDIFDPSQVRDLRVSSGPDADGDQAHFLDFVIDQDRDPGEALAKRLRLRDEVHRRLFEAGDETFPYVWISEPVSAEPVG